MNDVPNEAKPFEALSVPPALLAGENPQTYRDLLASIRAVLGPVDVLDEIWARDMADLAWDVLRLRRHKVQLIQDGWGKGRYIGDFARYACEIERIEVMTAAAEARRDGALRVFERRRARLAEKLRNQMEAIGEAVFRGLPKPSQEPEAAA